MVRAGTWGRARGLIVARKWGRFIRYAGDGAVIVYAPMGAGKGTGLVIPNLLVRKSTIICTDPKGENLAVTGRWRATLGPVWRLDAIHPDASHSFNPLTIVRVSSHHEADDAAMIADLLVIPESHDQHWDSSAKQLIAAVIRHILHTEPASSQTLSTVRERIASDASTFASFLADMAESPIHSVAEEARITLASLDSDEVLSVVKNAAKALAFWSRDRVGGMLTGRTDFDFLDMHRHVMTVFICVPEEKLRVYQPFLRMMMGCALAAAVRGKEFAPPHCKPLLLIDECPALGHLEMLASGLGYLRAYVKTLMVFQDLGQLKRLYGEHGARSFMAASGCQVAFNVNDNDTARELAETLGTTTVLSRSQGVSHADQRTTRQAGHTETARYLMDAGEVRRVGPNRCLVFLSGCLPLLAKKVRHYRVREWTGRWDAWREAGPAAAADRDRAPKRAA